MVPSSQECCVVSNCCCCCCCGCNLKTGSLFYGWLTLITDVLIILIFGYSGSQDAGLAAGLWLVWVMLGITIVQLIVSFLLLVGISNNNVQFIQVFVFVNSAILVLTGSAGIIGFVAIIVYLIFDVVFVVTFIIGYSLCIYYTVVVHSYAISLEEGPMQPTLTPYQVLVGPISCPGQHVQPGKLVQPVQLIQPCQLVQPGQLGLLGQPGQAGMQPVQPGWQNLQPGDAPPPYKA